MKIQPIPKRKMSIRQVTSKNSCSYLNSVIITDEWVGTKVVAIRRLPQYGDLVQQLEPIFTYNDNTYRDTYKAIFTYNDNTYRDGYRDRYNCGINNICSSDNSQIQWEIVGMVDKENPVHEAIVVLVNELLDDYAAIPYNWFKFLYDRVPKLHLESTSNFSPIICKADKEIIGVIMPYRPELLPFIKELLPV